MNHADILNGLRNRTELSEIVWSRKDDDVIGYRGPFEIDTQVNASITRCEKGDGTGPLYKFSCVVESDSGLSGFSQTVERVKVDSTLSAGVKTFAEYLFSKKAVEEGAVRS